MKKSFGITSFFEKRRWRKAVMRMKLFTIFMLVGVFQLTASVKGQNALVNLNMHEASLVEFFSEIAHQTDYEFLYNHDLVSGKETVSLEADQQDLKELLEDVLYERGLDYQLDDNVIIISKREYVAPVSEPAPAVQEKRVTGNVTDENGIPLPGVSVVVKGTSNGVATDIDGNYSIKVEYKDAFLIFSFVGMTSQEVAYNGQAVQNVILSADSETLGEVVVTGLQTIEKGRATGSFQILKSEELDAVISTDFREKLIGAASGVYVDKDNNLMIRGQSTFNASTKPLIVVDGIPLESSDFNINPNDIDQISILKDAASASIWGVRAANGVVVISTKRGKKDGKLSINYSGSYSVEDKVDISDYGQLNSAEYAALEFERLLGKGFIEWGSTAGSNPLERVYLDYEKGLYDLDEAWKKVDEIGSFDKESQVEDLFYRRKTLQQHNISLSVGTERASHYFSVNYDKINAELVGNSSEKVNFVGNTDINLSKGIDLQLGVRGVYRKGSNNGDARAWERAPYLRILDKNGDYENQNYDIKQEYQELTESKGFLDWSQNNLRKVRMNDITSESSNITTSLKLTIEPIKNLKYSVYGSYEIGNTNGEDYYSPDHDYTRFMKNTYTEVDNITDANIIDYHLPKKGGILDRSNSKFKSYVFRNTLDYLLELDDFCFKVMGGTELYSIQVKNNSDRLYGYDPDIMSFESIDQASLAAGILKGATGSEIGLKNYTDISEILEKYASYFGSASVTYKEKYDLFTSLRLDQTNMLVNSSDFRNNPSWSVGTKWHISEEAFFGEGIVNDLALKVSYGLSGNIDKSTGPDMVGEITSSSFLEGLNYLDITNPENKELGWEKTKVLNVGCDFAAFNSRLMGTVEIYNKVSNDVLSRVSNDPTAGWSTIYKNAASIRNRGIDINLNARILDKKLKWDAGLNFSYNNNEVTSIDYTPTADGLFTPSPMEGQSIDFIAAIKYGGLDETGEPLVMKRKGDEVYAFKELSNFTIDDYKIMGRATPPVFGSFNTSLKYNGFNLSMLITYKFGHKMRLPAPDNSAFIGFDPTKWMSEKYRWVKPGDEAVKMFPKLETTGSFNNSSRVLAVKNSDYLVDDADIIRLKSIRLGYDLSKLKKILPIKGGELSLSAENVWFWAANRYNLDSDYVDSFSYRSSLISLPARSKYTVSLKLNL